MRAIKIAITIAADLVDRLDELVRQNRYPSRSRAVQEAVREKIERVDRTRLARECEKLDRRAEQKMADEALTGEFDEWPEY